NLSGAARVDPDVLENFPVRAAVARQPVVEFTLHRVTCAEPIQILSIFIITAAPCTQNKQPLMFHSLVSRNNNILSRQYILKGKKEPLIIYNPKNRRFDFFSCQVY